MKLVPPFMLVWVLALASPVMVQNTTLAAEPETTPVLTGEWCHTQIVYDQRHPDRRKSAACPLDGACDVAANRDAQIPGPETRTLTVRLHFVILTEDDGSSPATSLDRVATQVDQINFDFAPVHINFIYTAAFAASSAYRQLASGEEFGMKEEFADNPSYHCNIYVTNVNAGYAGLGTFPWDFGSALGNQGGVIIDNSSFGPGHEVLTHELGHNLGLWHTHHGVSEVDQCSECWELAGGSNGDVAGDFCSDTDPTPVSWACGGPGGNDPCNGVPWGLTDPENFMGYGQDICWDRFSSQQYGRMQCWTTSVLGTWIEIGLAADPRAGAELLPVNFTYASALPGSSWIWDFGDGDSAFVQDPMHVYSPGLYDVTLTVNTDFGTMVAVEDDYIAVWADTLTAPDVEALIGEAGFWEIAGVNAVPVSEFILPINLTNVTSVVFFDSISFVGTRLAYFESKSVVYDNRFAGQLAMRLRANNGGGSAPLAPGSGPIARVHYRVRTNADVGDTSHMSVTPMGSWSLKAVTAPAAFVPIFNEGTLTVASLCDCSHHGDIAANDGFVDALDLSFLIDHLFAGGAQPPVDATCTHLDRGDYNCDGADDSLDLSYLIDLLFQGGDPACDPCACTPYPSSCP